MQFEINDMKAIGEALEGIVEKLQEQFEVKGFTLHLRYPGYGHKGTELDIVVESDPLASHLFSIDINEVSLVVSDETQGVEQHKPEPERFAVEEH